MAKLPAGFVNTWRRWQHSQLPTLNFRQNRTKAPTYGIELRLDHLASDLHSIGLQLLGGKNLRYNKIAAETQEELNAIVAEINALRDPGCPAVPILGILSASVGGRALTWKLTEITSLGPHASSVRASRPPSTPSRERACPH